MMDCFALLEEDRRPWVDVESVKRKFLSRSSEVHPDRFHQASESEREAAGKRYAELNEAHKTLTSTCARLRHLLEMETGAAPPDIQQTPADLMDLFFECGALCRQVDGFLTRMSAADSPLIKASLFGEGLDWSDKVQALNDRIGTKFDEAEAKLREVDLEWERERAKSLPLLEGLYRRMSYYGRWREQLQSRFVRLAAG